MRIEIGSADGQANGNINYYILIMQKHGEL